jgi:tetratricopeptide (TPR) repeat protein
VPVVFSVSSRYRLPMSALLCIPAGAGLAVLVRRESPGIRGRRRMGWVVASLAAAISLSIPTAELEREAEAGARTLAAAAWRDAGDRVREERELRRAIAGQESSPALFNLGVLLEQTGRTLEARESYRRALAASPTHADAAGNLARLLRLDRLQEEALVVAGQGLQADPLHEVCWVQVIIAWTEIGRLDEARRAARRAVELGVPLDPGMLELLEEPGENDEQG